MRILVAETDPALVSEMQQGLERAGYQVTVAEDGMAGWQHLTGRLPPDLLVTRFHLGLGTPPGTALGLHARRCHPPIPVIYIPADTERARHGDATHGAVLIKPFALAELVAAVNRLLGDPNRPSDGM